MEVPARLAETLSGCFEAAKFRRGMTAPGRFEPIACCESSRSRRKPELLERGRQWYVE